jgi:hypothetical protein
MISERSDSDIIIVNVPMTFVKRGGKRSIVVPDVPWTPAAVHQPANTIIKAIGRAFRWRRLLENGDYGTLAELAAAEKINPSYVSRVLRLTLLSPKLIEALLAGTLNHSITIAQLMKPFDYDWSEQFKQLHL